MVRKLLSKTGVVLILLVLILLVASAVFGLLTYWLDVGAAPVPPPGQGRELANGAMLQGRATASSCSAAGFCREVQR